MKRNTKALIKDLELQIDYLTGYKPNGQHWKQEYWVRKKYVEETLAGDLIPQEVRNKIDRIQDAIYNLQNNNKEQPYICDELFESYKRPHGPIKVNYHSQLLYEIGG